MAKARKTIANSSFVEKNLTTALKSLRVASDAVDKSVGVRARDAKKLTVAAKRLAKRKASLAKRKKLAATRAKKAPGRDTRQALRVATTELAKTTKELAQTRASKSANAQELALLKVAQRRTKGYARAIAQVDRNLG